MSYVLQCVQMKVSYGLVECVLQLKSKVNCLLQMYLDVVILLVLFWVFIYLV